MSQYLKLLRAAMWAEAKKFGGLVALGVPLGIGITLGAAMMVSVAEMVLRYTNN